MFVIEWSSKYNNKSVIVNILQNCFQFQLSKVDSSDRVNRHYESKSEIIQQMLYQKIFLVKRV